MLSMHFAFNLSFFVFITMPEKFSPEIIFHLESGLHSMLMCRLRPPVWN